jgi:hypothetical protein
MDDHTLGFGLECSYAELCFIFLVRMNMGDQSRQCHEQC